ncbi:hypothetical protein HUJ04_007648 [Dendroctonus ponderosae]|nr:hypothetical protein HUJ04_007648 [Dendroctonus ponderosae]KAH1025726.1 hypothetical protein HUJ05_010397 [Dendroctonus ponderosae]
MASELEISKYDIHRMGTVGIIPIFNLIKVTTVSVENSFTRRNFAILVYVEIGAENNAQSFNVGKISKTYSVFNDPVGQHCKCKFALMKIPITF